MHSTRIGTTTILHNGDYSGTVKLIVPPEDVQLVDQGGHQMLEVSVAFDTLKELVGQYLQSKMTERLEQMSGQELVEMVGWD